MQFLPVLSMSITLTMIDCRSREDTVRCVVSNLTEDSSSELSEELLKNQSVVHDDSFHSDDESDDWENWQPDPVDADPGE